jgi:hypothetical protein
LQRTGIDSLTWNQLSEAIPRFGRAGRFDNRIHNVIQTSAPVALFTSNSTLATFVGLQFNASNDIAQFSSWAAVFDQYRIMEIEVWVYSTLQFGGSPSTYNPGQSLYTVNDYDDANTPSTISQLCQYENVMVTPISNGHYRKWRPHCASAVYSGAFTSFANEVSPWIDVASASVQHYGLKAGVDVTNSAIQFNRATRIWVQFRNVF